MPDLRADAARDLPDAGDRGKTPNYRRKVFMNISDFTARRQRLAAAAGDIAYTEFGTGPTAVFVHGLATSGALSPRAARSRRSSSECLLH